MAKINKKSTRKLRLNEKPIAVNLIPLSEAPRPEKPSTVVVAVDPASDPDISSISLANLPHTGGIYAGALHGVADAFNGVVRRMADDLVSDMVSGLAGDSAFGSTPRRPRTLAEASRQVSEAKRARNNTSFMGVSLSTFPDIPLIHMDTDTSDYRDPDRAIRELFFEMVDAGGNRSRQLAEIRLSIAPINLMHTMVCVSDYMSGMSSHRFRFRNDLLPCVLELVQDNRNSPNPFVLAGNRKARAFEGFLRELRIFSLS